MRETDIVIIGAGCAGTSLAHHLENEGFTGKVEIYDIRTSFDREQRWCTWSELPVSLEPLVDSTWDNLLVCDRKSRHTKSDKQNKYKQIYAPNFFDHFHKKWEKESSNIRLNLGKKITNIRQKEGFAEVQTDSGTLRAKYVFDARNKGSRNFKNLDKDKNLYLSQTFIGWKVKYDSPVFNQDTATLMDFSISQSDGLSFMYVLPYSETEALVESTCFSEKSLPWHKHILNIESYLTELFGTDYEILAEESGELPMTTAEFDTKLSENIYAIGIAGGHVRPSSGYAFHRIQRHTQEIAKAIVENRPLPKNVSSSKFNFFDSVFLQAIKSKPQTAYRYFLNLFSNVESASLTRFLLDESRFTDDLKVIAALPKLEFLSACMRNFTGKLNPLKYVRSKDDKSNSDLCSPVDGFASRTAVRNLPR